MIDWAVFRMMRATRREQQIWTVVSDGVGGWLVHDYYRHVPSVPSDKPIRPEEPIERHLFEKRREAEDYVTYRIHLAALMAVLCFWRKL